MATNGPEAPETWQNNLNQRLLRRFVTPLFHPGVIRPSVAGPILGRVLRMTRQLPLLDSLKRRSAAVEAGLLPSGLPVVAAQPAPPQVEKTTGARPESQLPKSSAVLSSQATPIPPSIRPTTETRPGPTASESGVGPGDLTSGSVAQGVSQARRAPAEPAHVQEPAPGEPPAGLPLVRASLPPQILPRAVLPETGGGPPAAAQGMAHGLAAPASVQPEPAARELPRQEPEAVLAPLPIVHAQRSAEAVSAPPGETSPAYPATLAPARVQPLPVVRGSVARAASPGPANPAYPLVRVQRTPQGASGGAGLPVVSTGPSGIGYPALRASARASQAPRREAAPDRPPLNTPALPTRRAAPAAAGQAALIQRVGEDASTLSSPQANPSAVTTGIESAVQAAASTHSELDVDDLAEKVMRKIATEMKIERERRGM